MFPAYGLRKAGIDPDKDIKAIYAGSHTSSFEALYNHKVDAGELNSEQLESATQRGHYKAGDVRVPVEVGPDPDRSDHRARRPAAGVQGAADGRCCRHLDLSSLPEADRKIMGLSGMRFVPQTDGAYDGIRDLVKTLHIDLDKLS